MTKFTQPYYIAPEVFDATYDYKCDIWSLGVVLYIMLSGKVPFPGETNKEIIENVLRGKFHFQHDEFKGVSNDAKDLICHLMDFEPTSRYNAEQAYNHKWVQNIKENQDSNIANEAFVNMRKFIVSANLKKATLIYLASKLPERDLDELRKLFIAVDLNGDGKITIDEFGGALNKYGIKHTNEEVKELMDKLDTNQNGYIDYTEFLAGCMKSKIYLKEDYLKSAFAYFDKVIT